MTNCVSNIESFPSLQKVPNLQPRQSGEMIPLFSERDENAYKDSPLDMGEFPIKYVYAGTIFPRSVKGPYRHTIRSGRLHLLSGKMLVVHRKAGTETFHEDYMVPLTQMWLPKDEEYCLIGLGNEPGLFIMLCDYAWIPGNQETVVPDFSSYNFSQWGIR